MKFKCYLDGKEIADQNLLAQLGEAEIGVFESLRVYNGMIFRLEEHLKRLSESAKSCGLSLPTSSALRSALSLALKTHGMADGFIRLNFRGDQTWIMIGERKHNLATYEKGVDLKTSSFRMPSPKESVVQAKSGFYRLQLLDQGAPSYEYLFLDENHFLTESRVGNFFIVRKEGEKNQILTPPAHAVLNGVTRGFVIECAREMGFCVKETPITRHEAFNAEEAFLTNTSWEILPVRSLDARTVQAPIPGPVTRKLISCFHRKVSLLCQTEKRSLPKTPESSVRLFLSRIKKV